jgi:hypothetical protein
MGRLRGEGSLGSNPSFRARRCMCSWWDMLGVHTFDAVGIAFWASRARPEPPRVSRGAPTRWQGMSHTSVGGVAEGVIGGTLSFLGHVLWISVVVNWVSLLLGRAVMPHTQVRVAVSDLLRT